MNRNAPRLGWKMVKFGDVVKNVNSVERGPEAAGIERIVGLDHLDPGNLHIRRWDTPGKGTSFTRKFTPGQTLFGKRRAYQHKVAYAEFEGICSGDILTFEPKNKTMLLPELLPFICQTDAFFEHALGTSAGSLSPRTNWGALSAFEFALPPIEEQKRIAEVLWAVDSVFESLVVVGHNCSMVLETEIRALTNQALVSPSRRLGDYLTLSYGHALQESMRTGSGYPVVGSSGVVGHHESFLIDGPAIIVGRKGAAGSIIWCEGACWPIDTTYYAEPVDPSGMNLRYLYYILSGLKLQRYVITTAIPGLSREDIYGIRISIPSLERQQQWVTRLDGIAGACVRLHEHLAALGRLKATLSRSILGGDDV